MRNPAGDDPQRGLGRPLGQRADRGTEFRAHPDSEVHFGKLIHSKE